MVWAQKNTSVLAVGVSLASAALPFGATLMVEHRTLGDAEEALANSDYSVLVVDAGSEEEPVKRLIEFARALHPGIRVIFAARRKPAKAPAGEMLVAGNGRQLVRGLCSILGC